MINPAFVRASVFFFISDTTSTQMTANLSPEVPLRPETNRLDQLSTGLTECVYTTIVRLVPK